MSSESKIAVVYARTSTKAQESIPEQVAACRGAAERAGYVVRYVIKDEGYSGKSEERPGFQRVLELARCRRVDVIVVWKLDRLIRSLRHLLNVHAEIEDAGIGLVSVTEQFDTNHAFGRFAFRMLASVGEMEREIIGERARLGRATMASRGQWTAREPPYGYSLTKGKQLEVNRAEAVIVQRIFALYNAGHPLREIEQRLQADGLRSRSGRRIMYSNLPRVVRNPIYIGQLHVGQYRHQRPDLRIIHDRTYERAKARWGMPTHDGRKDERRSAIARRLVDEYIRSLQSLDGM